MKHIDLAAARRVMTHYLPLLRAEEVQAPMAADSAAARPMARKRFIENPGIILMCRSIKKAPSFGGSGLEKADFR